MRANEHEPAFGMEFARGGGERTGGTAWRVLEAPPRDGGNYVGASLTKDSQWMGLHHLLRRSDAFLFAHIIAEVCDAC